MFEQESAARGGAALFQPYHVLKAIWHIGAAGTIGRKELAGHLGIGEGSTRKLVAYMEKNKLASVSRQGIRLEPGAVGLLEDTGLFASPVDAGDLTVGGHDFGVRLRGMASIIGKGIEQRDEAIKAGASGATTLVYAGGLKLSDGYGLECNEPDICQRMVELYDLRDGDVLIIGTGDTPDQAENGALAAAMLTIEAWSKSG